MHRILSHIAIAATLLTLSFRAGAADIVVKRDTLSLSLFFKTNITSPTFESRDNIERAISTLPANINIEALVINGWASPEGTEEANIKIADKRSTAAEFILCEYFPLDNTVITKSGGTDWNGLRHYSKKYFSKEDCQLIENTMNLPFLQRKASLAKIRDGKVWKEMYSEIFPLLRRADVNIIYTYQPEQTHFTAYPTAVHPTEAASRKDTVVVYHKDTVYYMPMDRKRDPLRVQALYPRVGKSLRRPVAAIRSNLLMPLLNIGVECPINNRWSVAADFYYPWCPREWMNKWKAPQMKCIQGLGGYLEGRYWFGTQHRLSEPTYGKYRLLGHSLGAIAGAACYDIEKDGSGEQGEVFVAGIGYTYAVPLGKKGQVHLEFEIAAGAVYRIWHPYNVREEGGYLLRGKDENGMSIIDKRSWGVYPIKAGISLVVPIFTDRPVKNKNTRRR